MEGRPLSGDEVVVVDPQGQFVGRGFYSPGSALPVRLFVRSPHVVCDLDFIRSRVTKAKEWRAALGIPNQQTNGYRLIHGEGDDLPGLIVDMFNDTAVVQVTTIGMKQRQNLWLQALLDVISPKHIIDRTSLEIANKEGFIVSDTFLYGEAIDHLEFMENGFHYSLPVALTQKTGFYFDHRVFRQRISQLAKGKRVLDAFCFVGSFSLACARGDAESVEGIDKNEIALQTARQNAQRNGFSETIAYTKQDVRRALLGTAHQKAYDLVICDPPKLVPSHGAKKAGLGAYEQLAEVTCNTVRDGGLLAFCSCSASVSLDLLTRALAIGARKSGVRATVLERHFQGLDHPVPACFPEGLYLKSLLVRIERSL